GKRVKLPLLDKEIEIITDEHVDPEFGTGIVKVTPAHDVNDYEVGKRHHLEFITIFNEKGILNHHCGEFEGQSIKDVRKVIVKRLEETGHMEKIEEHTHQLGHCYRCSNVIEPYISKQWFLKKEVAANAIKKVNDGEAKFFPPSWKNNYDAWMGDLRDWCISRQLYWGHSIPVFYCESCNHEWADEETNPRECPHCSTANFHQDPDVLDTWFSSALWPFSTLGWGNENNPQSLPSDLKDFYPNSLLITGFDILFFWVARMLMMGVHFLEEVPFKDIYLHALVRDEKGHKMSKSKGNVIDPLDIINDLGADTLRFTLCALAVQGRDIKLSPKHLEQYRNFGNKIFNAHKYLKMKQDSFKSIEKVEFKTDLGKYMRSRFFQCVEETRSNLDNYRYNDGAMTIYKFMWNEFCDWGIELSKVEPDSIPELGAVYKEALKLIHPFMPFVSEDLYHQMENDTFKDDNSVMVMSYPVAGQRDLEIERKFELAIEAIVSLRRAKVPIDMANKKIELGFVKLNDSTQLDGKFIEKLAKVQKVEFVTQKVDNAVTDLSDNLETYIKTDSVDLAPIIAKLEKQLEKLGKERQKLEGMLNNKKFVENAPADVLEKNKEGLSTAIEQIERIEKELSSLKG
ncbi:MAG: valine--tRNA ligase, partial [Campylobacterales bacterium]|nr:valine--tRNA ligase [Campylobacterales bacterium]